MTRPSTKAQTLFRLAVILGILILLNIVSVRIFGRLDMTRNNAFTLSSASRELMASLDDRVTVRAYFTEDLPAPYNNNRRQLLDFLNEYRAYSRGNLQFEFINPSGEKGEQEAQQQGIAPVQVQVLKEDKFEVTRAYMGAVFLYEDRKEVLPVIQNMENLEYELSSTIRRLVVRKQVTIGFLTGHGEPGLNELQRVQELLRRQYEITTVDVSKNSPVPQDVAALVVAAPSSAIPEPHKYQIDQYLMRGGKVAFLLNRVDGNLQSRFAQPVETNLDDLLSAYGMKINADLVRDVQCANVSIVQQQFGFSIQSQVPFPLIPVASTFNRDNMMVKDLQGIILFFVSSVDTTAPSRQGLRAEVLIRSSKQSGRLSGMFPIDPLHRYGMEEFAEQEIPLALLVSGRFGSAYAGKPAPSDTAEGSAPLTSQPLPSGAESRVVLVGDGDFIRDQYGNRENLTFFANMMDYLVDDAGLITIRAKEASLSPLEPVSDATKKAVKYGTLVVPPLLVIAYGLLRWRIRKLRKKALEAQ
jgi:gliding-associated putative ABC transporter substrate-binding component GldG